MKVTLIFPMAGDGARFGHAFKPFLQFDGRPFIENALMPFEPFQERVARVVFVYRQDQDDKHRVTDWLEETLGRHWPIATCVLAQSTQGPGETVSSAVAKLEIEGPVLICDCDHRVDVSGIFETIERPRIPDVAFPTWSLQDEDVSSWAVAAMDSEHYVRAIAEKDVPQVSGIKRGVIGCYFFRDVQMIQSTASISDSIAHALSAGQAVLGIPAAWGDFFGDPNRLALCEQQRRAS